MRFARYYMIVLFLLNGFSFAAQENLDSLIRSLSVKQHDTSRCRTLYIISETAPSGIWQLYNSRLLSVSKGLMKENTGELREVYTNFYIHALINSALDDRSNSNTDQAISKYKEALELSTERNLLNAMLSSNLALAEIYRDKQDFKNGLKYIESALSLLKHAPLSKKKSEVYAVYAKFLQLQGDSKKAEIYYDQAIQFAQEAGDLQVVAAIISHRAEIYQMNGDPDRAREDYFKVIDLIEGSPGSEPIVGQMYSNIGAIYFFEKNFIKAQEFLEKSIERMRKGHDPFGEATMLYNSSSLYYSIGQHEKSLSNLEKAYEIASTYKMTEMIHRLSKTLYKHYKKNGSSEKAYKMLSVFQSSNDSLNRSDYKTAIYASNLRYEFELKTAIDSVKAESEKRSFQVKLSSERQSRNFMLIISASVLIISILVFFRIRIIRKQEQLIGQQKMVLEAQKQKLEEKQKELIDSLHYAKRIQLSFLPSEMHIARFFRKTGK